MTRSHDEIRELIAPVALGAASRDEVIQVEAHARGCEECRRELEALRATADVLALAPEQIDPPDALRERIMSQVRAEAAGAPADSAIGADARQAARERGASGRGADAPWWRSLLRPVPALAAAMAVVLVAMVAWNVSLQGSDENGPEPVLISAVEGTEDAPRVSGRVMYIAEEDALVLRLQGLDQLPRGEAYHLWTIDDGIPKSAGVFRADASGQATLVARGAAGAEAIGLTAQAYDQTDVPEGPLLMTASLVTT